MSPFDDLDEEPATSPLSDALADELDRTRAVLDTFPASSMTRALRIRVSTYESALSRCPRSHAGDPQRRALCDLVCELRVAVEALRTKLSPAD